MPSETAAQTINIRARADQKRRLRSAAEIEHTTVSAFVMQAAEERADRVIAEHSTTWVPAEYFDALYANLDAPSRPNEALAAAAARPRRAVRR